MPEKKKDYQEKYNEVYQIVAMIPKGKVVTYGQLAMMVGGITARQAGYAMRKAPPMLPVHRVVNSRGELAPEYVFGDREFQRRRLEKEGITFTAAGNIHMEKHLWTFEL